MKVSNLLAHKGSEVATISQERTVGDAVSMLKERRIGALVVSAASSPYAGILSERDIVRALADHGTDVLGLVVADLMTSDVTTCGPDTTVTDLMGLMTDRRIRHVPVVSEGGLVGMVSIGDVVKARFDELEGEKKELLEYVSAR